MLCAFSLVKFARGLEGVIDIGTGSFFYLHLGYLVCYVPSI
jgi:hypothetical protein